MNNSRALSSGVLTRIFAAYLALLGLICGLVYAVGGALSDLAQGGPNAGTALAFFALIVIPIVAALIGLIVGYVLARPVSWILMRLGIS